MRRTLKNKREISLKRQLEFVRTTVRELTPAQLGHIKGGTETAGADEEPWCPPFYTWGA